MFGYYLDLAWRSLVRHKVLTALMVLAIGLGIGATMTMLTVLHVMTADPIPGKSAKLFHVQIDPRPVDATNHKVEPPKWLSWVDAMNLLHARKGVRQVAISSGQVTVVPPQGIRHAFFTMATSTTAGFFSMFDVPFVAGGGWTVSSEKKHARVVVISRQLADKLYGTPEAVGKTLRLGKTGFRVVGVIGNWHPEPRFYNLKSSWGAKSDAIFLPLQAAMDLGQGTGYGVEFWNGFPQNGNLLKSDDVGWLRFWVQLDTPAQVAAYRQYLVHYSQEQKQLGRFQRPPNIRLRNVMQWLAFNHVVPGSVQLETLLALAFLLVCLVNTVALLLVKFLRRGGELSVRRAMGASRRAVFLQLLVEAALVGLAGGVIGLLLSTFGLWVVRQQPASYAAYAHLDGSMLFATFVLAVAATLLAALLPAWRACRLMPARLLKTQ